MWRHAQPAVVLFNKYHAPLACATILRCFNRFHTLDIWAFWQHLRCPWKINTHCGIERSFSITLNRILERAIVQRKEHDGKDVSIRHVFTRWACWQFQALCAISDRISLENWFETGKTIGIECSRATFEENVARFKTNLKSRGYPGNIIERTIYSVLFKDIQSALQPKTKANKQILPSVWSWEWKE